MNTKENILPLDVLAQIFAGAIGSAVKVHTVELDPSRSLDEQIDEIIEQQEAAHRAVCKDCAAAYEAAKPKVDTEPVKGAGPRPSDLNNIASGDSPDLAGSDFTKSSRRVVGYMAFDGEQPIPSTFNVEHDTIAKDIAVFKASKLYTLARQAARELNIRPVYVD